MSKQVKKTTKKTTTKKPSKGGSNQKNGFAIAGFVLSFFLGIFGIIFSPIGFVKSKKMNGKGKALSIAGMAISCAMIITVIILYIYNFVIIPPGK